LQVLDEADEMLNKGFADDVEHLMQGMPSGNDRPQTMLFSATEPVWVKDLAKRNLVNHHTVDLVGSHILKSILYRNFLYSKCATTLTFENAGGNVEAEAGRGHHKRCCHGDGSAAEHHAC
jgi:hypothetical protein